MSAATLRVRARPDLKRSRTADCGIHRAAVERQVKPCSVSRLVFDGATVCPGHRSTSHGFSGGLLPVAHADRRADTSHSPRGVSPGAKNAPAEHNYDPNRLREYRWKTERDIRRETQEAADRFYKHTYGTAQCNSVELKFHERTIDGHRLQARQRSLQRAIACVSPSDPALANITSGRLLERLRELEQMRHPSTVIDFLQPEVHKTDDHRDDSLYSQVAHSIGLFSHNMERTRSAANFRSRTRQTTEYESTPRILSAAPLSARNSKSADTYIDYLECQTSRTPNEVGLTTSGPPPLVYSATGAEGRLLQMVADCNNPDGIQDAVSGFPQEPVAPSDPQRGDGNVPGVASDKQPHTDLLLEAKTTQFTLSEKPTTSNAKVPDDKPPKNGLRKVATVAPPRRHKSSTVRVPCRPVVKKELTIIVPMI